MSIANRRILVTGADGFIGKNLVVRLGERPETTVTKFVRGDDQSQLPRLLAGENRPLDDGDFVRSNVELTSGICDAIEQHYRETRRHVTLVFASSSQATIDSPYGRSKLNAERAIEALARVNDNPCVVFRLPGVFGKWCKPDYNSVVATFCYRLSRNLPIQVNDPSATVSLVHVDQVVSSMLTAIETPRRGLSWGVVDPVYTVTVGELAQQIRAFADCRSSLMTERVGEGFVRALYSTYISFLPSDGFSYRLPQYTDSRGVFVEMLKTPDCGQFSFFTAKSGAVRGGHYHHTKTEKFLVLKGIARFRFRNILSNDIVEFLTDGDQPCVVDTIPGWSHDIANVGGEDLVVMLWSNEIFDRSHPDTVPSKV
jgi:UDP-2-acetamido-2,6-beta-L-arabino-hexul-4-ose reductase